MQALLDAHKRWHSYILVSVQFACLGVLTLSTPVLPFMPVVCVLLLLGISLAVWAIVTMRVGKLSILPDIRSDAQLVMTGPYLWLRHPIYTGLVLCGLGFLIQNIVWWRIIFGLVLLVVLVIKVLVEEHYLIQRFPAYANYMRQTWRLVPGVW